MSTVCVEAQGTGSVLNPQKESFLECSFRLASHLWELGASSTLGEEMPRKGPVLNSETSILGL